MVFEICRWRRTQNYLLSNRFLEEVKQNALLMIGHLFLTLELLCLAVTFLLFFIGQICELLKPVGIFLWKYCLKRNHFQNKNWWEKFLVLLKWTNEETKPCKGQIIISVWFTITVGPNAFVCELGWEPKISFASVDETWVFCAKQKKNLSLDYFWQYKHLDFLIMQILMYSLQKWVDMVTQTQPSNNCEFRVCLI